MGDDLLRPFQHQLIADYLVAQAAANFSGNLDADNLAKVEEDFDDKDVADVHRYDDYFDIGVKREGWYVMSLFFLFSFLFCILFPLTYYASRV